MIVGVFGDGTDGWSFLSRDAFKVMLGECADAMPASELGDHSYVAYVTVQGVDQFYADVRARGAAVTSAPANKPWGLHYRLAELSIADGGHSVHLAASFNGPDSRIACKWRD